MKLTETAPAAELTDRRLPAQRFGRLALFGGVLLVALSAAGFALRGEPLEPRPSEPLPVRCVSPAAVGSGWSGLRLTGLLRAPRVSELAFGRGEILLEVAVEEGQRVERGALLTALDPRRIQARRTEAEARLAQARAQLDELERGPRAETLAAARAAVRQAEAEVALWSKKRARRARLVADGVASSEEGDENEAQLAVAEARLDVQREQLRELENGTRPERLAAQRALVAQLEGTQRAVESDWVDTRMVAPFAGFVAEIRAEVGEVVIPGSPIVRLVEDAPLEAWIGVPPETPIEPGARTEVDVDGRPVTAWVKAALPELDPTTRTRTVILTLARDPSLTPGRVATWRLPAPAPPQGWTVPLGALVRGERDTWSVFALAGEGEGWIVERRRISVEGTDGERAWVAGDLGPEDRVIADGTHRIVPGQRVQPSAP
ncbi:MAG: HlyD family efflux transporter periplasmic adaptor subunit [Planctomycetes bacterium]|nr:HlyD family efflux transporter periplasmic adaptor subunit [Planctomycetota bacterium]